MPVLVYDGDCRFCARWVARWKILAGHEVEFAPFQESAARFPEIPSAYFEKSVYLFQDGVSWRGAEAVFRVLAYAPGKKWPLFLYHHLPGFAALAEFFYARVAAHRGFFSRLTLFFQGKDPRPDTYFFSRRVFFKILGLSFLAAFASLLPQISGLIGTNGILPAGLFLKAVSRQLGSGVIAWWQVPTLAWLNSGTLFLQALCAAGIVFSCFLILGRGMRFSLIALWVLYLSLVSVGQDFLAFQWDVLLLEAGLLAFFLAPPVKSGKPLWNAPPPAPARFLLQCLLFKLMFLSGIVKLASHDPAWRNLSALEFHYQTQPLPSLASWFAHQLPAFSQKISTVLVFVIELAAPFMLFFPRRLRHAGAVLLLSLQALIFLTGNYCFFNLLTLGLCLLAIDDTFWPFLRTMTLTFEKGNAAIRRIAVIPAALIFFLVSSVQIVRPLRIRLPWMGAAFAVEKVIAPFHSLNNYGLFAVMTTRRLEIFIEGSYDAAHWSEYEFRFKPGNPAVLPAFTAPHQPRLDWQMWFAALSRPDQNPWFLNLCVRLLQGQPDVLALLKSNPFEGKPPRYIRAVAYEYRFTGPRERLTTKAWWKREYKGVYLPALELKGREEPEKTPDSAPKPA